MRLARIDRLFHSIVVLGAALGAGCSSKVDSVDAQSAAGSGSGSGAGGEAGAGGSSGEGGAGGGGGAMPDGGLVIDDPSDCASSAQFSCTFTPDSKECYCDPNKPASPEACEKTADFHCWEYDPMYVTCECVPGSPEKEEDCGDSFYFYCAYYNPPVGCQCVVPIA